MNVFAAAMDALFADPSIAEPATWRPAGAPEVHLRVIRRQPDQAASFGSSQSLLAGIVLEIRKSEAVNLSEGDLIELNDKTLRVLAEPVADSLGLVLTAEAAEV